MPASTESRRTPWFLLILSLIAVPLVVAAVAAAAQHGSIENDLTPKAQAALDAAGTGGHVSFTGREAEISGVAADKEDAARKAVEGVDGVRQVSFTSGNAGTPSSSAAPTSPAAPGGPIGVNVSADKITLTGAVPDQMTKDAMEAAAKQNSGGRAVDNQLAVSGGAVDAAALQKQINDLLAASPITFAPDSADFTPQGADTVKKAAELLKGNSGIKVAVSGHVSKAPGSEAEAQALSDKRAAAVQKALTDGGVTAEITAKGFGDTKPLANTPPDAAANRRVEINVS